MNNGVCVSDGLGSFICRCPPSLTGRTCDFPININNQPINPCSPNPCANGGQCIPVGNSFQCICPPQCTGPTCNSVITGNLNKTFA